MTCRVTFLLPIFSHMPADPNKRLRSGGKCSLITAASRALPSGYAI